MSGNLTWSQVDICYNSTKIISFVCGRDASNIVQTVYDTSDITTNILVPTTDPLLIAVRGAGLGPWTNNNTINGFIVNKFPQLSAIFKSATYFYISNGQISVLDNFGTVDYSMFSSQVSSSSVLYNGLVYYSNNNLRLSGYTSYTSSVAQPTIQSAIPINYSLYGSIKYFRFKVNTSTDLVLDNYCIALTSGTTASTIIAMYGIYQNYNLVQKCTPDASFNFATNYFDFGDVGTTQITSVPSLDAITDGTRYTFAFGGNNNFYIRKFGGSTVVPTLNNILLTTANMTTTLSQITEPLIPPPTYAYTKIQLKYNSTVNGNSVGGVVFEGYYQYTTSDNKVVSLYSSSDLSTNLLIPSTDSFVTGALTLLGKTTSNIVTTDGISTTSTHAGLFVKNLPFVNALFKSNPYVLLKPSGLVMFDNYGVVNSNVLATSYFTNKYVMSNGNVYSNKNNSFFSFSNFTFTYNTVSAMPTVNVPMQIDYTFFNTIKQIKYNAKYNGAVLLDSYFVFYLDSSNNYHMCAQYPTTENKNVLLFSDSACDNFPNTGNFGNTLGTVNPDPTVTTIVAVSGNAASATVTTSTVSVSGTASVSGSVTAVGTVAQVNLNALNSNICFSEGSIVTTDQGDVEIQNIDITYNTIQGNKIIALTETQSVDDYLVKIKKNAFGNVPTQDTETTGNHMIFNGLSMVRAKTLINGTTIEKIPYRGLPLYNILLEKHDLMMVNGLVCETLNPENPIAKYYIMMAEHPENKVEMENMWRKRTQEIIHAI